MNRRDFLLSLFAGAIVAATAATTGPQAGYRWVKFRIADGADFLRIAKEHHLELLKIDGSYLFDVYFQNGEWTGMYSCFVKEPLK